MRISALLLAFLASLLLAGCYKSKGLLLDASAARQPITRYQDWTDESGSTRYHYRLNPRSDGWYDYEDAMIYSDGTEDKWAHHSVLMNDLGYANGVRLYVYATWDDEADGYVYGIVGFGDNFWRTVSPDCGADPEHADVENPLARQIALTSGAKDDGSGECVFTDRDSLLAALRRYVNTSEFWQKLNG
jgi:hypothetical protein